jgi:hypothetical protein
MADDLAKVAAALKDESEEEFDSPPPYPYQGLWTVVPEDSDLQLDVFVLLLSGMPYFDQPRHKLSYCSTSHLLI